jgi:hypothetical protein
VSRKTLFRHTSNKYSLSNLVHTHLNILPRRGRTVSQYQKLHVYEVMRRTNSPRQRARGGGWIFEVKNTFWMCSLKFVRSEDNDVTEKIMAIFNPHIIKERSSISLLFVEKR